MIDKMLGQINETVFDEEWGRPRDGETTKERSLRCFQAAAEAVAKQVEGPCYPKERAVIEAARKEVQAWRAKGLPDTPLCKAVKALDSEEG